MSTFAIIVICWTVYNLFKLWIERPKAIVRHVIDKRLYEPLPPKVKKYLDSEILKMGRYSPGTWVTSELYPRDCKEEDKNDS